jgi:hypothetical protein
VNLTQHPSNTYTNEMEGIIIEMPASLQADINGTVKIPAYDLGMRIDFKQKAKPEEP